ncbi:hypothetical protein [Bordetella sp. 15P40C-2]|uniref:hypothetical protein n=1 Tax=Bordetella sp. 15P40C-2 TaxID=2572246 RepID=UPI00132493C1|nr:hypothetical protein [Bordetella sp. 15P40C-2]MVW73287.1 hypothetical protein [Bordetella sp. 15P40C-2]
MNTIRANNVAEFLSRLGDKGVHEVDVEGTPLQLYLTDIDRHAQYILVGFHGLVSRTKVTPPVFYFRGVADAAQVGLISISDPSLRLSQELNLSWYLWNRVDANIAAKIAHLLDAVVESTGKRLILAGGSGGGFACMNVHNHMRHADQALSFAWNPQTDITQYNAAHLKRYFRVCFDAGSDFSIQQIRLALERSGVPYKLGDNNIHRQLIFINGYDHSHLRKHVRRYLKQAAANIVIGNWGDGHVQPDKDAIIEVIRALSCDLQLTDIVARHQTAHPPVLDFRTHNDALAHQLACRATVISMTSSRKMLRISTNIRSLYMGYQLIYRLRSANGQSLFDSGYLMGADTCDAYLELTDGQLRVLQTANIEVYVEDVLGLSRQFTYSLKQVKAMRKARNISESGSTGRSS